MRPSQPASPIASPRQLGTIRGVQLHMGVAKSGRWKSYPYTPSPSRGEGKFSASHAQRPAGSRRSQEETRSSECRDAPSEQHQNQLRRQKTRRLIRAPGAEIRCDENRMPFDQTPPRKTRGVHQRFAFSPRKSLTNMESAYHFLGAQNVLADRMDDTI